MESKTLLYIIEIVGTFAFAISGIRLASTKQFDWFRSEERRVGKEC